MKYDMHKVFDAINTIKKQEVLAKNKEPDDFDYGIIRQLNDCAQQALYQLTRGVEGEPNHMELSIL